MANDNKLYRIEVLMHDNLPDINTCGMLMTNAGIAYVKLHPVKLKAKPKANAVEVMRCKDCNHVSICNCVSCLRGVSVYCRKYGKHMMMDDFCSYGERRADNDD